MDENSVEIDFAISLLAELEYILGKLDLGFARRNDIKFDMDIINTV